MEFRSGMRLFSSPHLFLVVLAGLTALGLSFLGPGSTQAQPLPPERIESITVPYTEYHWWLTDWEDDQAICSIYVDHLGIPDLQEIYYQCGEETYQRWIKTAACPDADTQARNTCSGLYLHLTGSAPRERTLDLILPNPEAWIDIQGCTLFHSGLLCSEIPKLTIRADEPLPNESITHIQGEINRVPFICDGNQCQVPLRPTPESGVKLEFWAESSYGDTSQHYLGKVQMLPHPGQEGETQNWYVYLLSDRKENNPSTGCSGTWESFPPLGAPPAWLADPEGEVNLATDIPYTYLAGKLIQHQLVDASSCSSGGLTPEGYATPCGLQEARSEIDHWQNSFDPYILTAAQKTNLPSMLLKRIIARESQFWPETMERYYSETGFGHLTNLGADTTFLWNEGFYSRFCPLVLSETRCSRGYPALDKEEQELLRTTLVNRTRINSASIIRGLEAEVIQENITTTADTFLATCHQINYLIRDKTDQVPGSLISHQDLWRFALVGYHGGSGCFASGLDSLLGKQLPLDWEHFSRELEDNCPSAVDYVREITLP